MARTGSWSAMFEELKRTATRNIHAAGEDAKELWLERTRTEIATKKAPAPRSSWSAQASNGPGGVILVIGWSDFRGGRESAQVRFERALLHYDVLFKRLVGDLELLGGSR